LSSLKEVSIKNCSTMTNLPSGLSQLSSLEKLEIKNCYDMKGTLPVELATFPNLKLLLTGAQIKVPREVGRRIPLANDVQASAAAQPALNDDRSNDGSNDARALITVQSEMSRGKVMDIVVDKKDYEAVLKMGLTLKHVSWGFSFDINRRAKSLKVQPDHSWEISKRIRDLTELEWLVYDEAEPIEEIGELTSLLSLRITNQYIRPALKSLPFGFAKLTNLQELYIESGAFTELKNDFTIFSNLDSLWLRGCHEILSLPSSLGKLLNLKEIKIESCKNLRSFPDELSGLKSLERLTISSCDSMRSCPDSIGVFPNLKYLWIGGENMILSDTIDKLTSLEELWIFNCPNLTALPSSLGRLPNLRALTIWSCPSLSSLPVELADLSSLKSLDVSDCSNLTTLPVEFAKLSSLESLTVFNCPNLTTLPVEFANFPKLKSLHITETEVPPQVGHRVSMNRATACLLGGETAPTPPLALWPLILANARRAFVDPVPRTSTWYYDNEAENQRKKGRVMPGSIAEPATALFLILRERCFDNIFFESEGNRA